MQDCKTHYQAGNYYECINCCRTALSFWPEDADLWFWLAQSLRCTNSLNEALHAYDQAIQFSDGSISPIVGKALILSILGKVNRSVHFYQQALLCFRRAIHLLPLIDHNEDFNVVKEIFHTVHYYYGVASLDLVKLVSPSNTEHITSNELLTTAISSLMIALEYKKDAETYLVVAEAQLVLARQLSDVKLLNKALTNVNIGLKLDHSDFKLYHYKGSILLLLGILTDKIDYLLDAIAVLRHAESLNKNVKTIRELSRALYEVGVRTDDVSYFQQGIDCIKFSLAVEERADEFGVYGTHLYHIAKLKKDKKMYKEALLNYDKALEIDPKVQFGYTSKARLMSDYGFFFQDFQYIVNSIVIYDQGLALNPHDKEGFYNKAIALGRIGEFRSDHLKIKEAIDVLDHLIELDSDYGNAYHAKAILLILSRDFNENIDDSEIASVLFRGFRIAESRGKWITLIANFFLQYIPESIFFVRFINRHPQLLVSSTYEQAYNVATTRFNEFLAVLSQLRHDLNVNLSNNKSEYLVYKAVLTQIYGDPIAAFALHDNLIDLLLPENLRHQYYYLLAAIQIDHGDFNSILKFALSNVEELYRKKSDCTAEQKFYYAGILMIAKDYDRAIEILHTIVPTLEYGPACFMLAECYDLTGNNMMLNDIAVKILKSGMWHDVTTFGSQSFSIGVAEKIIQHYEALPGWFIVGKVIDVHENALETEKVSSVRSKFFELVKPTIDFSSEDLEIQMTSATELNELKLTAERLMPRLFIYINSNSVVDIEKLAERMVSQMKDEKNATGRVEFDGYLELLSCAYYDGKISTEDFGLGYLYVKLKETALNKGKRKLSQHVVYFILRETISRIVQVIGEIIPGLPIKMLIKLIVSNSNNQELLTMNFFHFRSHFEELSKMQSSNMSEFLEGHEFTQFLEQYFIRE